MEWKEYPKRSPESIAFSKEVARWADGHPRANGDYDLVGMVELLGGESVVNRNTLRMTIRRGNSERLEDVTDTTFTRIDFSQAPSSYHLIYDLQQAHLEQWNDHLDSLRGLDRLVRFAFWTDLHLPYHDPHAFELAQKITSDFNPDILPDLSDLFEFKLMSRFKDYDPLFKKIWGGDIARVIAAYNEYAKIRNDCAPNAQYPQIWGNHDDRLFSYLAETEITAGYTGYKILKDLTVSGALYLGNDLDILPISPGFAVYHGDIARKDASATAKATFADRLDGRYSGMVGHIHRFGMHANQGAMVYTLGCLAQLKAPYTKKKQNWEQGMGLAHIDMHSKESHLEAIRFYDKGGELTAIAGGKCYSVKKTFTIPVINRGQRIPARGSA